MKEEDITILNKIYADSYTASPQEKRAKLKRLINLLSDLVEEVGDAKISIPTWKSYFSILIGKIIFTSHSITQLSNGFDYELITKNKKTHIIDYSSMYILTRSIIENYLMLCYLYNNKLSDTENIFRFKLWEVSGLISRQNLGNPKDEKVIEKKNIEKKIIDNIFDDIKKMDEYSKLDTSKLKRLFKNGLPRINSWHELINNSDLKTDFFSSTYSFFSTYAHTEFLSIVQLKELALKSTHQKNIDNVDLVFSTTKMIICLCIDYYTKNFECANIKFNSYPDEITKEVLLWKMTAKQNTKD